MKESKELKNKVRLFCEKYASFPNGSAAARYAGYSVVSASERACRLLKKPEVKKYIKQLQDEIALKTRTDAESHRRMILETIEGANPADRLKGLDQLAKMNGHYEKDNMQKQQSITMELNFG